MAAWLSPVARELSQVYPQALADEALAGLRAVAERSAGRAARARGPLVPGDCLLSAYPDHVTARGEAPLATLRGVVDDQLSDLVTGVHLLPFYPWSSDDGFAVKDYRAVEGRYGTWPDVSAFAERYRLMVDLVLNHASAESGWFRAFREGAPAFRSRFLTVEGEPDLGAVVRPRTSPLLTEVETADGPRRVWTTFGPDQVDLNYGDPGTLIDMVDILLGYVARGAEMVRLDAVAFLWKEPGTSCVHRPQTHAILRLLRAMIDALAPGVRLVTETNVPHADNVAYLGAGDDEAHLVYNFALPPLVLHTLETGDAGALSAWAGELTAPSGQATYLNFLASHDGIGLNPVRGLLDELAIARLVARCEAHGGRVSYRSDPGGRALPYELNINYFDALSAPGAGEPDEAVRRFLCAHAVAMAMVGVPLLYLPSAIGSRGWPAGVSRTGQARAINREKLRRDELLAELALTDGRRRRVRDGLSALRAARAASAAFDPYGRQEVMDCGRGNFAIRRGNRDRTAAAVCVHNVTSSPLAVHGGGLGAFGKRDLVTGRRLEVRADGRLTLGPFEYVWWSADG